MPHRDPSDAEVDAAFADLVAQFDREFDDHRQLPPPGPTPQAPPPQAPPPSGSDAADGPEVIEGVVHESGWRVHHAPDDEDLDAVDDGMDIPPLPPMRLSPIAMAGITLILGAGVITVLLVLGVRLPSWTGWVGFLAVMGGTALLLSRLPRHRDDDTDDGARV
ncbi:MAG TPA: hypothetical protein IAA98_13680 [Candidatus Avipropionibacterium avicola]|uniref:DUF308 domain-containing protein n=1 Tax=Candidatus Avipropionibacterium avicola TaxID=2840701 RepID=A0A9D1H0L0_9ACTN|nr:hypothetical protein [Candidatus Avipropionibacterium avicola]